LQQNRSAAAGLTGERLSNEDLFQFQKLFRQGLKNNNIDLADRRMGGGQVVAQVGVGRGSNLKDLTAEDAIVVAAADLHEEAPVWWMRVKQAAERGVTVVTINVRPTRLDDYASHCLRYRPGEALALVSQLVSSARVETESANGNLVAAAADALVKARNLVAFYGGEGLSYDETETLAKLLGNLLLVKNGNSHVGQVNNGLIPVWPYNNSQGARDMGIHPLLGPGYTTIEDGGLDAAGIYAGAASGAVKALYVLGADPVGDGLMEGRGELEFLVVQELFLTETAALADVVLPAQSWAERDGTFTNGERRVQRYYPSIMPIGQSRPDWQILAQIGERIGLGKPAFAASLMFRDLAKAVPQYKSMDYRSLARVEKQWPDVGGEDLYYGGNAYNNRSGLGEQWPASAEAGAVPPFDVPDVKSAVPDGLILIGTKALYSAGTLLGYSQVIASRVARPVLVLHAADAADLQLAAGDQVAVTLDNQTVTVELEVVHRAVLGVGLLRGVKVLPGALSAQISKLEQAEKELA